MGKTEVTGEVTDLVAKYTGRTTDRGGDFLPVWKPENAGEAMVVEYAQRETIKPPKDEEFTAHTFILKEWTPGLTLTRSENEITPTVGMKISASGKVLDSALTEKDGGKTFLIRYDGLGKKKGKKNAPKLFKISEITED